MKDLKELLMEHPFFRGTEETRIELIAGCGKNEHCDEGMYLTASMARKRIAFAAIPFDFKCAMSDFETVFE